MLEMSAISLWVNMVVGQLKEVGFFIVLSISVGYHVDLRVAITFYWEYHFTLKQHEYIIYDI